MTPLELATQRVAQALADMILAALEQRAVGAADISSVYTRAEAAAYLRLGTTELDSIVRQGEIASFTRGRRRLFTRAALDEWAAVQQANVGVPLRLRKRVSA